MLFHKEPFCGITDWRRREASLRGLALLLCPCSLTMRATLVQAGRFTPETAAHGRYSAWGKYARNFPCRPAGGRARYDGAGRPIRLFRPYCVVRPNDSAFHTLLRSLAESFGTIVVRPTQRW